MAHFGRIDTVICNAGINPELTLGIRADFFADQDDWSVNPPDNNESNNNQPPPPLSPLQRSVFDVNTMGPLYGIRLAMRYMQRDAVGDQSGRVVVIGSAASYLPVPDQPLYCASKHAGEGRLKGEEDPYNKR